jgi:glucose-6-phosphate-specific signal transduction histidine kinase
MTTDAHPDRPIDTRLKIAALWTATMLIFAYVDLFAFYRPDVRADLDAGKMFVFDIGQPFLFFTTLYVIIPAVMIYLTLVMPRRINRIVNMVLAWPSMRFTILGGAVGEWNYYVLGSLVEAVLLAIALPPRLDVARDAHARSGGTCRRRRPARPTPGLGGP